MFLKTLKLKPRPLVGGLLLAMSLMANAGITLTTGAETKLGEVFNQIQAQSNYKFFYDDDIAKMKARVVNIKDEDVDQALKTLFSGTGISYVVKDNVVYIKKEDASGSKGSNATRSTGKPHKISGVILDEYGDPLIGAAVKIKGTNIGVTTDFDGNYTLETSEANPVLECSYVGYKTLDIPVDGRATVDFAMAPDSQMLDEVVVTALGIKREQKSLSYNVQQLKGDALSENKDANFINGLAGKVAGVNINASSSGVGGISKVVMRGTKSIMQSSNALYVVDGMPMRSANNGGSTEFGSQGATEPIADINPEDIESMSVLTGAAAAALYGSEAANGAIFVDADQRVSTAQIQDKEDYIKLGSVMSKGNIAWNNSFSYKNIGLSFMINARLGGKVFSRTQAVLDYYGVSENSAAARDHGFITLNNGDQVNPQMWYSIIAGGTAVPQYYLYDATNVRLGEVTLSYNLPRKWLRNVCDVKVSFVGRNLWMIYNKAPFDPESVASTDNWYQGIDYFMMPSQRNLGFNINVSF